MRLEELFQRMSPKDILSAARRAGYSGGDAEAAAKHLEGYLTDSARIEAAYAGLTELEKSCLHFIMLHHPLGRGTPLDAGRVEGRAVHEHIRWLILKYRGSASGRGGRRADSSTPARILKELASAGLIFILRGGDYFVREGIVPEEIQEVLFPLVIEETMGEALVELPAEQDASEPYRKAREFIHDCIALAAEITKRPMRLTATEERPYANDVTRMMRAFAIKESFNHGLPPRFSFILDYVCSRRLVGRGREARLLTHSDNLEKWARQEPSELIRDIFRHIKYSILHHDPWAAGFFDFLRYFPAGREGDLDAVSERVSGMGLERNARHFYYPEVRYSVTTSLHGLVQALSYIGAVATSEDARHRKRFSVTPLGRCLLNNTPLPPAEPDESSFYVQPTFEVIAPSTLEPEILLELHMIAEPVSFDRVLTYRLTKESIHTAIDALWESGSILQFLESHSNNPIPQNVAVSINDWAQSYGGIQPVIGLVLKCASPELATEAQGLLATSNISVERLGPKHLLIDRTLYKKAIKALAKGSVTPEEALWEFRDGEGYVPVWDKSAPRLPEWVTKELFPTVWFDETDFLYYDGLFSPEAPVESEILKTTLSKATVEPVLFTQAQSGSSQSEEVPPGEAQSAASQGDVAGAGASRAQVTAGAFPEIREEEPDRGTGHPPNGEAAEEIHRVVVDPDRPDSIKGLFDMRELTTRGTRELLEKAIALGRLVIMDYYSESRGKSRILIVKPTGVDGPFFSGRNNDLDIERTFKLVNVKSIAMLPQNARLARSSQRG